MIHYLVNLIKGLSASEKIYFKRITSAHDRKRDNNYLKIYNAIDKEGLTSEQDIRDHFHGTTINDHLQSECNYLSEKLLIALFNYNLNRNAENKFEKGIILIQELSRKGFRKQALKKLVFVKKKAEKQEQFMILIRLIPQYSSRGFKYLYPLIILTFGREF